MQKCPFCGFEFQHSEAGACPLCGNRLPAPQAAPAAPAPVQPAPAQPVPAQAATVEAAEIDAQRQAAAAAAEARRAAVARAIQQGIDNIPDVAQQPAPAPADGSAAAQPVPPQGAAPQETMFYTPPAAHSTPYTAVPNAAAAFVPQPEAPDVVDTSTYAPFDVAPTQAEPVQPFGVPQAAAFTAATVAGADAAADDFWKDDPAPGKHARTRAGQQRVRPVGGLRSRLTPPVIAALCIAAAVVVLVIFIFIMRGVYSIGNYTRKLRSAVANHNTSALSSLLQAEQTPTEVQLNALCDAFNTENLQASLVDHVMMQYNNPNAEGTYPALQLESSITFGLFRKYYLAVQPVSVQVTSSAQDIALQLNGEACATSYAESKSVTVFTGLFPGRYSYVITGTGAGQALQAQGAELLLMNPQQPGEIMLQVPTTAVTIGNCVSADAVLYMDGEQLSEKPVNGTVTIGAANIGSDITIEYEAASGSTYTATVTVQTGISDYTFETYESSSVLTSAQQAAVDAAKDKGADRAGLNSLVNIYFGSYYECVQNGNMVVLQHATPEQAERLEKTLEDSTLASRYNYVSASINADSAFVGTDATMLLDMKVNLTDKTSANAAVEQYYTVKLRYLWNDGGWHVDNMVSITQAMFDAGEYGAA